MLDGINNDIIHYLPFAVASNICDKINPGDLPIFAKEVSNVVLLCIEENVSDIDGVVRLDMPSNGSAIRLRCWCTWLLGRCDSSIDCFSNVFYRLRRLDCLNGLGAGDRLFIFFLLYLLRIESSLESER
jgi:hypothetical protein